MRYTIEGLSHGLNGRSNQDAWAMYSENSDHIVVAVADGVGGHAGGATAARIAVNLAIKDLSLNHHSDFENIFHRICNEIEEYGSNSPNERDMATTLSVLSISGGEARFGHVGDSRIYHLREQGIIQITDDQTEVALLVKQGILSPARAKTYKRKSVLTSALSARRNFTLDSGSFSVVTHDRLMLLTDGVYRTLSKKDLRNISISNPELPSLLKFLNKTLLAQELTDDATLVAIQIAASEDDKKIV